MHNLWNQFRCYEVGMAKHGSGLTREQMQGAVVFYTWLETQLRGKIMNEAEIKVAFSGIIITKAQIRALVLGLREFVKQNVGATAPTWDDWVFGLLDPLVFNEGNIDKLAALLGAT